MIASFKVESLRESIKVSVVGFEIIDEYVEMIRWLRKGTNFRQFVIGDIEHELYSQDGGAQLLSVRCREKPKLQTKALRRSPNDTQAIVTQFSIMFPLALRIQGSDVRMWNLEVEHSYHASNMEKEGKFALRLDFTVVDQQLA